jgi:hypothetical protein
MNNLDNLILEDIKGKTQKYLGFAEASKNRFDAMSFSKIVESVKIEFQESSDTTISEFFKTYHNFDIFNIEKREFEDKLKEVFAPYLSREQEVLNELEDISNYLLHIQIYKSELQKQFNSMRSSLFLFLNRKRIGYLKIQIDYLSMVELELKNASLRRARWGVDLIIGDFYIILLTFYYLIRVGKNKTFIKTVTFVQLSNIVSLIKDMKKFYLSEERIFLDKFFLYEFEKIFNLES